ncbi:MAG: putative Uncharacterized deoxyribonuclease YabD [Candidatus Saccharibacteria bacterium]|nr:putative Uncharacterized deoxyribonuclease YabD [Candidatus Saccharibacteria bacterium]
MRASAAGVAKMICVGTSSQDSKEAVEIADKHQVLYAAVGIHPHESQGGYDTIAELLEQGPTERTVAVGEIGLDYFYTHSSREQQIAALEGQLQLAHDHNLPVIFHVREAFDDFWPIYDNFHPRGVLHSFTDSQQNADAAMGRGLFIGVNGISTFTRDERQRSMFAGLPLDSLLLETDAPFLTPVPLRGTINEPALVEKVAEFHANLRRITIEEVALRTTTNAHALFTRLNT